MLTTIKHKIFHWYLTTKKFARAHKFWSVVIVLVLLGGGWYAYGKITSTSGEARYVLGTVHKGTIISTVSGSGQVSASQQLNLIPQVSGTIVYVGVSAGQVVSAGTLIAEIDPTDAQKAVRDAQANLASAQIALEKLQKPASALDQIQTQNALQNAQDALAMLYTDSAQDITDTILDLPSIMAGLEDATIGTGASRGSQWNIDYYRNAVETYDFSRAVAYRDDVYNTYVLAKSAYDSVFASYKNSSLSSADPATMQKMLGDMYAAVQKIAASTKSTNSFIQYYKDQLTNHTLTPSSTATVALTNLASYTATINTHSSSLLSDQNGIKTDTQTITEKTQALADLKTGADALDVQSAELTVAKAQNALQDAQNNLTKYFIRAPFAGTIATVAVHKYDQTNGAIATLITKNQLAQLSLNEVDAAKISLGEMATLTFDAIPGLTLTGKVSEINPAGLVSQGVVTYDIKIAFDTQDPRVKTGMTINADIQTAVRHEVLLVPQSAVKTQNGASFVLVFSPPFATSTLRAREVLSPTPPIAAPVETGIADDVNIEIISGLDLGEQVVIRTMAGSATPAPSAPSIFSTGARGGATVRPATGR
jgi:HlyD family secretion protein